MTVWSRFLRATPGSAPFTRLPDCHTAIEMDRPEIIVVERTEIVNDPAKRRSVGLTIQQNGVRIDIAHVNHVLLCADLMTAVKWKEEER